MQDDMMRAKPDSREGLRAADAAPAPEPRPRRKRNQGRATVAELRAAFRALDVLLDHAHPGSEARKAGSDAIWTLRRHCEDTSTDAQPVAAAPAAEPDELCSFCHRRHPVVEDCIGLAPREQPTQGATQQDDALHGQDFGFSEHDAALLRAEALLNSHHKKPNTAARLNDLADRIAALLPPRETP